MNVNAYADTPASSAVSFRLPGTTDSFATRLYIRARSTVTIDRPPSTFTSAPGRWSSPIEISIRAGLSAGGRSEEHTSELQSHVNLVCRLLLEKKKKTKYNKSIEQKKITRNT